MSKYIDYSIPYMGSKRGIAEPLINRMLEICPSSNTFVDLFGGGGAMSFRAIQYPQFKEVYYNDFYFPIYNAFNYIVSSLAKGEDFFKPLERVVPREDFFKLDVNDAVGYLLKMVWSFGNTGKTYLWGMDKKDEILEYIELIFSPTQENYDRIKNNKLSLDEFHELQKEPDFLKRKSYVKYLTKISVEAFTRLVHLKELQKLQRADHIHTSNKSYDEVDLSSLDKDKTIVYCDIPYEDTAEYSAGAFDHKKFYEWAMNSPFTVFISSYHVSDERLYLVDEMSKRNTVGKVNKLVTERLYCNKEVKVLKESELWK